MSKRRKLEVLDTSQWYDVSLVSVNWDLCVLCQKESIEPLINPTSAGYSSLVNNLNDFAAEGALPPSINILRMDDGSGMLCTLQKMNAKYHKKCRNKYDTQKLGRCSNNSRYSQITEDCTAISTRSSSNRCDIKNYCLFCGLGNLTGKKLINACTKEIGPKIHAQAVEMQDSKLLAKIPSTDFIAFEVKYHNNCYTNFRNSYRSHQRAMNSEDTDPHRLTYGSVISELVQYMEDMFLYSSSAPVFKLCDLVKMVIDRMSSLGAHRDEKSINRTRLKEQLMSLIPGLREDKAGRDILLTFENDMGDAIREACDYNDFDDGMCIARAADILRRDLFNDCPKFCGSFADAFVSHGCVPPSLVNFITTLLGGHNIDSGSPASCPENSAAYSIAQLIRFNSVKRKRLNRPEHIRHHIDQETPLPVYLGLMIHNKTRKKTLVERINRLGLCISYDRVMDLESIVTNGLCSIYRSLNNVVPVNLANNVFTTAAIDNIDNNPSSSTSTDSFHGSSVTIIQHPNSKVTIPTLQLPQMSWTRKLTTSLPETYTAVPVTGGVICDMPLTSVNPTPVSSHLKSFQLLCPWLDAVKDAIISKTENKNICFAAYHAANNAESAVLECNNSLLPLLPHHINSPATIRHLMNVIIHITNITGNGQPAVITADEPVYAIAKYIQWKFPTPYGEDKIVMMLGGLHIEMAVQNMIGKWLAGSGWTEMFIKAEVATSGRSESLLKSSHVKRTRYAHEVSLAAMSILRNDAYNSISDNNDESLEAWMLRRCSESAQFLYWNNAIELESLLLTFVRSIRESNFQLFVQTLRDICPWLFALDSTNYSRWLPVFVKTLEELPTRHPIVYEAFMNGHFTSRKSHSAFSAISDDHLHEQNNKMIKGDGGAVGILANPTALLKWMVAGPEISRMVHEFEQTVGRNDIPNGHSHHHEATSIFQKRYIRHVSAVVKLMREDGNPFAEQHLQTADNQKICMSISAEQSVFDAAVKGKQKHEEFVSERLVYGRKSLRDVIQKVSLELFKAPHKKTNSNKLKITDLRNDSNLFCKLYVASQSRPGDIEAFFAHENNRCPPSISEFGKLRSAKNKSEILPFLQNYDNPLQSVDAVAAANVDHGECALILDGAAIVHMLPPGTSSNFNDYCSNIFVPYIDRLLQTVQRIDLVFDCYLVNSLKLQTRTSRGSGQRINVKPSTIIPKQFDKFLSVDSNKEQLFTMIAKILISRHTKRKLVICTIQEKAYANVEEYDLSVISPCNIEEADGRLLLHAHHAFKSGLKCVTIRTVDSDVVVISLYAFTYMTGTAQLWIDFGVGRYRRLIPIHDIHRNIPQHIITNLPVFHAFTGCDTVSTFCGIGKKTAWNTWMSYPDVSEAFHKLSTTTTIPDDVMEKIERFVVLMYDGTSACANVNECRRILYTRRNRAIENIPPTGNALQQHCKRAALQAKTWMACLSATGPTYDPTRWGWIMDADGCYTPHWSTIPDVSQQCSELLRCSCKKACKNCKCKRNGLRCTKLCACDGLCHEDSPETVPSVKRSVVIEDEEQSPVSENQWQDVEEDMYIDNELEIVFDDNDV